MTGVALSEGFELALTVYAKRPNVARQELVIEIPGQPPVTIVTVFDGAKAWMANPMTGNPAPVEMPASESATVKAQSDFDGALIDYQAKGYTVTLLDPAAVAGKKALHLRVSRADLPTQHIYLDPDTFVELRVTTEGAAAGDTDLSDYKSIEGIMVPHSIKISQGGSVQAELKILRVEFNTPMDDALFRVK
jgi:outer membrane lipoprotein-sorting protein